MAAGSEWKRGESSRIYGIAKRVMQMGWTAPAAAWTAEGGWFGSPGAAPASGALFLFKQVVDLHNQIFHGLFDGALAEDE